MGKSYFRPEMLSCLRRKSVAVCAAVLSVSANSVALFSGKCETLFARRDPGTPMDRLVILMRLIYHDEIPLARRGHLRVRPDMPRRSLQADGDI